MSESRGGPAKPYVMADVLASSQPSDWRPLDPANTLYLEVGNDRVVIELAPEFAPNHVANIKTLVQSKYYDGLAVVRVNDNYIVQWTDPEAGTERERPVAPAKANLAAEFDRELTPELPFDSLPDGDLYASSVGFSNGFPIAHDANGQRVWLINTYGAVGVGREDDISSGNGSELYAVIGHAPRQLDRNTTVVGRVRYGIEVFSSLPRGAGTLGFLDAAHPAIPITKTRLAIDVPEKDRIDLEVLRTDTPLFAMLIESRRNRHESFWHRPAGHVDIGNVPLPVRLAGNSSARVG